MTFVMLSTSWWRRDHDVTSRQVNERELWVLLPSKTQALYTSQRLQLLSNSVTNHPSNFVRIGTHEHRYILEYSKYQSLTKRFSHRSHDVTLTGVEWFTTSPHHQPLWHLFTNHQEWKQNELSNYSYRKFGDFQEWIMSQREQEHCTHAVTLWLGICLDVRSLWVASLLGFLLLPPATQICGKRVFWVAERIDGVRWAWRNTPGGLGTVVDREAQGLCCY